MKAAALFLVVPLVGCASVWGFDDLTEAPGDAAANPDAPVRETGGVGDAGSDVGAGSDVDARSDVDAGSDVDGGSNVDAGPDVVSTEAAADAMIEGGGDGGSSCPSNALLCDGFESGSIDMSNWDAPNCSTMTSMDIGTVAHRGSHSLHVHVSPITDTSYANCTVETKQVSIFASTPMYFRGWINLTANTGARESILTVLSTANGSASAGMGLNSTGQFIVGVQNTVANNYLATSMSAVSPNAWTCIELEIDTDYMTYPNGMLAAWDSTSGTPDPQLAGTAKLQPLFATQFGLTLNGPSTAVDLYIDDIVISNSYIGCSQ